MRQLTFQHSKEDLQIVLSVAIDFRVPADTEMNNSAWKINFCDVPFGSFLNIVVGSLRSLLAYH